MLNKQTVLGCRHVAGSTACLKADKFLNVTVTDQEGSPARNGSFMPGCIICIRMSYLGKEKCTFMHKVYCKCLQRAL